MTKDFDSWNEKKKKLEERIANENITTGEVWWVSLGLNIGREEDGKNHLFERPVVIIKKYNRDSFLVLPLSSKIKTNPYRIQVLVRGQLSDIILSQPRLISNKRFLRKITKLRSIKIASITEAFINSITTKRNPVLDGRGFSGAEGQ